MILDSHTPNAQRSTAGGSMARIFLSYARTDRATAQKLADVLSSEGHDVWWDRHLHGGKEFADEIEVELEAADIVLVAWSKHSGKSRWVRDEAAVGGDSGRLVPVTIDGTLPPIGFRQFHTLDLSGWKAAKRDGRTQDLLQTIERKLAGEDEPEPGVGRGERLDPRRSRALSITAAIALLLAAAVGIYLIAFRDRGPSAADMPTIALLPITTASNDPALRELAPQVRDSIAHRLSQSDLQIQRIETAPREKGIAGDYRLSGELSKSADQLIATIRLDDAAHGITVFSKRFEGKSADAAIFAERIGVQLAGSIAWAVPLMALEKKHPSPPAVLADLLGQLDFTSEQPPNYLADRRAAERAPRSAFAQVNLAMDTGIMLAEIPRRDRPRAIAEALRAAERAKKLAPEFGDVHAAWCMLHSESRIAECEDRLRVGKRIDPGAPFVDAFLSSTLRQGGRFEEAFELTRLNYVQDPYVPTKIGNVLQAYEFSGEAAEAHDLYEKAVRWWPEFKVNFLSNRIMGKFARSDFDGLDQLLREEAKGEVSPPVKTVIALVDAARSKSVPRATRACAAEAIGRNVAMCAVVLAQLGDLDAAFAMTDRAYPRRVGRTPAESERIWLDQPDTTPLSILSMPSAAALRRDPRFLAVAQRVGILPYWRSGRLPDFCRQRPEPVCAQLKRR